MILALQPHPRATFAQIEGLQLREIQLRESVGKLEAQRPIIERQTRSGDPSVRASAENQLVQIDLAVASSKVELESVREQLASRGPRFVNPPRMPGITVAPQGRRSLIDRIDNDAITAMFVMTCLAILVPLSIGIARRLWRQPPRPMPTEPFDDMKDRMERLEQAVDAVAIEIERVAESQRFVAKVLVERPSPVPAVEADAGQALNEGKPFLALGAGPVEPIPVAQRQAVRQSITPH